ncbi:triosephosphate isomerase [Candidatus Daviesbacteria bacterium]|nr:triosephosphate isomerase [Candidatus Daviesbacteria bacterium]
MNKNLWVIVNFKSNLDINKTLDWVSVVGPKLYKREDLKIVVCPDFLSIEEVKKQMLVNNFPILVGSQDLSPFPEGSYTGEEAAKFLSPFIDLAILGHSERRKNFAETDEMVAQKVMEAKKYNIIPLVCVQGENTPIPNDCNLVAYEPIFAIGTGNPDTPSNANSVATKLKTKKDNLEVLYGGSVNFENVKDFLMQENINGVLVATGALNPSDFLKIISQVDA